MNRFLSQLVKELLQGRVACMAGFSCMNGYGLGLVRTQRTQ